VQEGVQHLLRAVELDPSLYSAHIDLAHASIVQAFCGFIAPGKAAGRVRRVAQVEHALDLFPDFESTNFYGSLILAFNGKPERAIAIAENLLRRSPYSDLCSSVHAYALARGGRKAEARSILERLQWLSRERFVLSSFTPAVAIVLGDEQGAIRDLGVAAEARCPWFFQMLADPRLEVLRTHPEFIRMQKTLERMEASVAKGMNHHRQEADADSE
jgi:hypothetical protein